MRYHRLGEVSRKRHVQFHQDGELLTEEVLGSNGLSGNESTLYHLHSPSAVKDVGTFTPIVREEWLPEAHVHRHLRTSEVIDGTGDPVFGRRLLMWNEDVEIAFCKPEEQTDCFYRNGEGDELVFVHHGRGVLETQFGTLPFRPHDYLVIPRGTTCRFALESEPQVWLTFQTPGEIETPARYRNRYGQLLEQAPYSQRDLHPPAELATHAEEGEFELVVRVRGGHQRFLLDRHPFDVVGWDGYVYPYTFNLEDFEPLSGRVRLPPPIHQTFQGRRFAICSLCPRSLADDPLAVPLPYHRSSARSEEITYHVSGELGGRRGIEPGSITLHPSGLAHGPQPGLVERSLAARRTDELAVMCTTFRPLRLTPLARELDDPSYALSWAVAPAHG